MLFYFPGKGGPTNSSKESCRTDIQRSGLKGALFEIITTSSE